MDLSLISTWIIQGLILFGFAIAGVYVALRLFGDRSGEVKPVQEQPAVATAQTASEEETPSIAAAPPPASTEAVEKPESSGTAEKTQPPPAPDKVKPKVKARARAKPAQVQQAFEFTEDERLTVVLEMPESILDDTENLAEAWVETVGWARVERLKRANKAKELAASVEPTPTRKVKIEPEKLQAQLNQVLQRLQLTAERRRHLRTLLEERLAAEEAEIEEE